MKCAHCKQEGWTITAQEPAVVAVMAGLVARDDEEDVMPEPWDVWEAFHAGVTALRNARLISPTNYEGFIILCPNCAKIAAEFCNATDVAIG